jgi:DNA-binding MarR family transcriptional regulator
MSRQTKTELLDQLEIEMRTAQAAIDQMNEAACSALGINRTDLSCMEIIDREQPLPAGRLAQQSGLTTAAITAVIDRLEKAGYARRLDDPSDRRRVLVELTPLARERVDIIWGPFSTVRELLSKLPNEHLSLLVAFHQGSHAYNAQRAAEVRELRFDH